MSVPISEGKDDADQPLAEIRTFPCPGITRRAFGLARGTFTGPDDSSQSDPEIERMFYGELP